MLTPQLTGKSQRTNVRAAKLSSWVKGKCLNWSTWVQQGLLHWGQASGRWKDSNLDYGCQSAEREEQVQTASASQTRRSCEQGLCSLVSGTAFPGEQREKKVDIGWYELVLLVWSPVTWAGSGKKEWWQNFSSKSILTENLYGRTRTPAPLSFPLRNRPKILFSAYWITLT